MLNDMFPSVHALISLASVRGHFVEGIKCTTCGLSVWELQGAADRDRSGMPTCLAQTGMAKKKPTYVYVSGPLTTGQMTKNIRDACDYASALFNRGYAVYLPHASVLWEIVHPATYDAWLAHDFLWVARCDCVLRFPGKSGGADLEVAHATKVGVPVFYDLDNLYAAWPVEG